MLGWLARGSLGSLGIKLAVVGLAFLNQLLVTRLMGAEQYGIYVYALTWLGVLGLVGRLGTDGMLTRFTAAYAAEQRWGLLLGLIRFGYGSVIAANLLIAALAFLGLWWQESALGRDAYLAFRTALPLLPIYGMLGVGQALLYGFKRPLAAQWSEIFLRVFMMVLAGAVYWYRRELTAYTGMLCGLAAAALVLILSLGWVRKGIPGETRANTRELLPKYWLSTALPLLFIGLTKLLLDQSDILLIGLLIPEGKAVGIYSVAMRLAEMAAFGLQAVSMTLAPMISELHAAGRKRELQDLLGYAAYGIFGFTLLAGLVLFGFGEFILKIFGADFVAAYPPMMILMGGQVINALTGTVGYLMVMTGHQKAAAKIVAANMAVTLALNLFLIPEYGLKGAATASATGLILLNLANLVFVVRQLGLNPTVFRFPAKVPRR